MSNETIDYILDNFDFEKVKKVMDVLEWKYWDSPYSTVTIAELRQLARKLLTEVYNEPALDRTILGSGGFEAERRMYPGDTKKYLHLKFVVAEWYNEY